MMKALILSGGGVRGAYHIGVLRYLTETQKRSWNLIAGVSVGALNGSYIAQYTPPEQTQGVKNLENIWKNIKGNKSIYKPWLPSLIPNFVSYFSSLLTGGLFSTNPLKKLIKHNFNQNLLTSSGIKLLVGAVSVTTGECRYVREFNKNLFDWIVASSAFPVAFPPVKIDNDLWIDGGIKNLSPLSLVLEHNPTEIDIIMTTPINGKTIKPSKNNPGALGVAIRTIQILNEEIFPASLISTCIEKGIKINVYAPDETIKVDLLNFSPEIITNLFDRGYLDARKKHEIPSSGIVG